MKGRRTYAYIQMNNLRANLAEIRRRAEPAKICAMIKADAYGHGVVEIAKVLQEEKVEYLAVALLEEALELKDAGIATPILVLGTASIEDAEIIVSREITQSIYDLEIARALSRAAVAQGTTALVHIKVDTGMSRQGILAEESFAFASVLKTLPGIAVEGIYSHFSEADNPDTGFATLQMRRFGEAIEGLKKAGIEPKYRHIANSGAVLTMPFTGLDMVRPGILLYGLSPSGAIKVPAGFKPVMKLCTHIANIREIGPGESVSYGRTFTARRNTKVALLPIGYADGYMRILSNRAEVLVQGKRAPVLGRICMDYSMVDVTDIPEARVGDEVIIFGSEELPVGELSLMASTIDYEITCGISRRVPRIPVQEATP
jgi:alanine racemase